MPPPMPNPSKRMTAQPSRPVARYRPGKPVHEEESSEDEESEEEQPQRKAAPKKAPARPQTTRPQPQTPPDEDSDEEGFVTDPEDEDQDAAVSAPTSKPLDTSKPDTTHSDPIRSTAGAQSDEESEEEGSSSEEESESEASSAESEAPTRKFQRPTFIKKSDRNGSASQSATPAPTPIAAVSESPAPDDAKARRLAETDYLISEKINRDNLARAQGRRAWDDDDAFEPDQLVDDTDGLDPEAEHAAWRLRELQRLKRDREALIAREKEIEESERRRNLTAEEREAEDKALLQKQQEEKDGKAQSGYLARYHHKGAFFQDSEAAEVLKKRDVMGARFEDEVTDKSALPEYMRIRDMNKLGKKGRTRYKDLRNEDTGGFGSDVSRWKGAMGAATRRDGDGVDLRGVDERFLPDDERKGLQSSGANTAPLGPRTATRVRSRSRSPRRSDQDSYRPRRRSYSRSRSRSRSPQRRKRSPSRDRYRDEEKRRRIEAT
ncbi:uncharacterized protein HMPREF1541_09809 [Cyphellophora europaea CBS 101466]|uniref:Micro-fibrillar-associated protein 1 C-terminal domain-containing protein n=1 Tax=Cyphellophora europaea (strain CBS 101466) TaxID=1220924 RepID=W2SAL4_CYPE1|nr:uncharacterized protein HMPREF1541_09809 [Cyphellophora europaea CBS 101466]ETN44934.1 hypothetical protein HMPREF1541_09809 [Cyphellophora europaea CBS 101466]